MPVNYNFAFKNSKLRRWERPAPDNLLLSNASLKKKIIYLYQFFRSNPELFYPPGLILIATVTIQIITFYPTNNISKLESQHQEYTKVTRQLSGLDMRINTMKKHLNNIKVFYSQSTPVYLFAFYLQNSIPQGVQLNNYFVSETGFDIRASAFGIEQINEMITLLVESPIISKNTLVIKKINTTDSDISNSTANTNVSVEIQGRILKLDLEKRKQLYKESLAHGLLRKLMRFNDLNQLIRS
ncbi:hypothetical protein [Prochlorococcus sp. MIT 1307]|uniref:hypothetical protein n=1 Tax=Prochlorococcus sp. MIT 1307 TaxID=3096219 RepID=UPI002A765820|nr:hypothetical protein [Prochlorococcus sp. MIT 1307]